MADIRLKDFAAKSVPIGADIIYAGNSTSSFNEVKVTISSLPVQGSQITTVVPLNVGGTNANLTASNGGIFYSTATAGAILAGTATAGQMLQSGASGAPSWSTATYPATTTVSQILYSPANNIVAGLTTQNYGVLATSSSGLPSINTNFFMGNSNTVIGNSAGSTALLTQSATQNVVLGSNAGATMSGTGAGKNTLIGYQAGQNIDGVSTATGNTLYGNQTGNTLTTGNSNTIVGSESDVSAANAVNQIVIGKGVTGLGNNIAVIGNSNTANIVSSSTTGGCYLGSPANPFGFLFLGTASNYVAVDAATQTSNGPTLAIPDTGGQPQNFALTSATAVVTTSQTMTKWTTYFANNASQVTFSFPATIAQGDTFIIVGQGAGGFKISQPASLSIKISGTDVTTTTGTGGNIQSTNQYDTCMLVAESSTVIVARYFGTANVT